MAQVAQSLEKATAVYRVRSVVQLIWPNRMYAVQLEGPGDGVDGIRVPKEMAELFEPGQFVQVTFERVE